MAPARCCGVLVCGGVLQDVLPVLSLYVPVKQDLHDALPISLLYVPALQDVQFGGGDGETLPISDENKPVLHPPLHAVSDV